MHIPAWPVLPDSTLAPEAVLEKFRVRSLMGLGTCDESGCDDDGSASSTAGTETASSPGGDSSANLYTLYPPMANVPPAAPNTTVTTSNGSVATGYTMPSQGSSQWPSVVAALVKGGMTLAQIQNIQPGTVVSANGAILRQNPGYSVPLTSSSTNVGVNANAGGSLLIAAAVGVVALMMFSRGRG